MTKENNNPEQNNKNYVNSQSNENYNQNYDNSQFNESYNQNYDNSQFNENYNQNYNNSQFNKNYNQNYDNYQFNENYNQNSYSNTNQGVYQQNNIPPITQNYNTRSFDNNKSGKDKKKNSIIIVILTAIVTFFVLVVALYFGYNKFVKKENIADISTYEVNFIAYGTQGEGKPEIDIKKIPTVENTNSEISNLLANPDIVFDKQSGLKNGDKVEVTITLNKNTANKLNLKTKGEFIRTFTVNGLSEKAKETVIVRDNSSSSSSSNSSNNRNRTYFSNKPARIFVEAGVNLRSNSDDTSTILATAKKGDTVYVDFTESNSKGEAWSYVSYNGEKGWMRTDLIGH